VLISSPQKKMIRTENFSVGDTVKVHVKIKEGNKERVQIFQGIVLSIRGQKDSQTFMVRKIAVGDVAVERIWPVNSPSIAKVEVVKSPSKPIRRAKLFYMRKLKGSAAKTI